MPVVVPATAFGLAVAVFGSGVTSGPLFAVLIGLPSYQSLPFRPCVLAPKDEQDLPTAGQVLLWSARRLMAIIGPLDLEL
ncbi:MAG: hypothetical protein V2A77_04835 [Pseudomonadota bacterium]